VSGGTGRECPEPCPSGVGCGASRQVGQSAAGLVIGAAQAEWTAWAKTT
jgi:hypothetical protein